MNKNELFQIKIQTPDQEIMRAVRAHWDSLSKPIDGLGDLEDVICRIGAIQKTALPRFEKRDVLVFCADNGITEEGVSQTDQSVTQQVARLMGCGKSTSNVLAEKNGATVHPVDIGINTDLEIPGVLNKKVRKGTRNFLKEPAMTESEALLAIETGISLVEYYVNQGSDILLTGEMGIGNTTTTSALLCLLTGEVAESFTGRGAGLSDEGLFRKLQVVKAEIEKYRPALKKLSQQEKAFTCLCSVGGLDIAAMCGVFLGGAIYGIPVLVDGVISAAAAYLAECFAPGCKEYMLASHAGREPGLRRVLQTISLKPLINCNMALGEGTGAILCLPLIDTALTLYRNGTTFTEGNIGAYERFQ